MLFLIFPVMISLPSLTFVFRTARDHILSLKLLNGSDFSLTFHFLRAQYGIGSQLMFEYIEYPQIQHVGSLKDVLWSLKMHVLFYQLHFIENIYENNLSKLYTYTLSLIYTYVLCNSSILLLCLYITEIFLYMHKKIYDHRNTICKNGPNSK